MLAPPCTPRRAGAGRRGCALAAVACSLVFAACSSSAKLAEPTTEAPATTESSATASTEVPPATDPTVAVTEVPAATNASTPAAETVTPAEPTNDTAPVDTEPVDTEPVDTVAAPPADPLDDLDEDGETDTTCGTADLGGGLVVATLCNDGLRPSPEGGVIPTAQSLLLLPNPPRWDDLADVDATARVATTTDGRRVVIYVLGSDTLFDSGSAALRSTAEPPLAAIVASIQARFPGRPVNVRGAADSVGDPAANQSLSEKRAAAVSTRLAALGVPAALLTSQGLGETVPVAEETNSDGSVSDIGRQVNRRVEIVVG